MNSERSKPIQQFDVFRHPLPASRAMKPYLVILQGRRMDHYRSRIVAPLVPVGMFALDRLLNPIFTIQGQRVAFFPADIANVPASRLASAITSIAHESERIVTALDIAFSRA